MPTPGFAETKATTVSPGEESGAPTTAASRTPGKAYSASSTSRGHTLKPEAEIMSFFRSTRSTSPSRRRSRCRRVHPTYRQDFRGLRWLAPVSGHHARSPHNQFAMFARADRLPPIIHDDGVGPMRRNADRQRAGLRINRNMALVRREMARSGEFSHSVGTADRAPEARGESVDYRGCDRRAA